MQFLNRDIEESDVRKAQLKELSDLLYPSKIALLSAPYDYDANLRYGFVWIVFEIYLTPRF